MRHNFVMIFDTETTGIVDWKIPSDDPSQPHIVSLSAGVFDVERRSMIQSIDLIVRPDGWEIPQEAIDVHGITNEYASKVGLPEKEVARFFLEFWHGLPRVAHNTTFDNRIIRIAFKRYINEAVQEAWKNGPYFCTMTNSKQWFNNKWPKLEELYRYLFDAEIEDAHNSFADMEACAQCFYELIERGVVTDEKF